MAGGSLIHTRSLNALKRSFGRPFVTSEEALYRSTLMSDDELLSIRNLGSACFNYIRQRTMVDAADHPWLAAGLVETT